MVPSLSLRFPGRRYHATPWGNHVNEGQVEWPPSPWRLLRALIATGYASAEWGDDGPEPLARGLLLKLAAVLPRYRLPPAIGAHSRHYMPLGVLEQGREKTTLVFDTWAQVDEGELVVSWDTALEEGERALLGRLADRLGYLGRAESWVVARLLADDELTPAPNCVPRAHAGEARPGCEPVALIAAQTADAYRQWRSGALAASDVAVAPGKAQQAAREAMYPLDLIAALQTETQWLRRHGWNQPPGSRRVHYWRPLGALQPGAARQAGRPSGVAAVEAMLLALTPAGHALLPSLHLALALAEVLHAALVKHSSALEADGSVCHSAVLSGCDAQRRPLGGAHRHAHILPLDLDDDGHLEHVLIWAPMGLDAPAQSAVRALRRTFVKGVLAPLRVALAGSGGLTDLQALAGPQGDRLRALMGVGADPHCWISRTPFVPPRYLKSGGKNGLEGQVVAELASRGLPPPQNLQVLDPGLHAEARMQRHFLRSRQGHAAPPVNIGFTLRLRFDTPLPRVPLSLGYGSHFGLGSFQLSAWPRP